MSDNPGVKNDDSKSEAAYHKRVSITINELTIMMSYALKKALGVPESILETYSDLIAHSHTTSIDADYLKELFVCHARLSSIVAPSTPESLLATGGVDEKTSARTVGILSWMFFATGISAIAFILLSIVQPWLLLQYPESPKIFFWGEFFTQLQYMSGSAVGASLYAMYTAHKYVVNRTFDPSYNVSYWIRFTLGILAGLVLANIISMQNLGDNIGTFVYPSLGAILGGYSSDGVNKVLLRFVETIDTVVTGSNKNWIKDQVQVMEIQSKSKIANEKLLTASKILKLKDDLLKRGIQLEDDYFSALIEDLTSPS